MMCMLGIWPIIYALGNHLYCIDSSMYCAADLLFYTQPLKSILSKPC
ncbi:protein of unknown function [Candidatus Nitrosocaldus cavascurensis]|uniref:Uncharacterized protein n=1 Tax=Candidatus Nitrosocaldus cavascurensis TaxID=2058097 RepID=A0A2K5ASF0_9ARCH|nr:protein of unknown function [Candidatus Nitrosocaldus cavascurensis]